MPNELKPEDVMSALECCIRRECMPCPNKERRTGITECMECLVQDALAILREKDAHIEQLLGDIRATVELANKGAAEKDAEIERLTIQMNAYGLTAKNLAKDFADYQADVQMEIADARAEAIDEFADRLKSTLIAGGIYPVLVKNSIEKSVKEMKEGKDG